jgi:geranylgeranyl pyrophosphate synthase
METTEAQDRFIPHAEALLSFIDRTSVFLDWPVCRQTLLGLMYGDEPWQLALPILACQATGGKVDTALPAAGAWTALRHASNLLDAVQDHDELPEAVWGQTAKALSCGAGLIFLAFQLASTVETYPGAGQTIMACFAEAGFDSARGQDLGFDLQEQGIQDSDGLETYWKVLILKSGSIYRAGAAGGAASASENEKWITALGQYGIAIGVMRQLIDDCRDFIKNPRRHEYETTLPIFLHTIASRTNINRSDHIQGYGDSLVESLREGHVPAVIADTILEWQRRALESLKILEPTDALVSLKLIPQIILEPDNIAG